MARELSDKPGGDDVAVTIGDMTTARAPGGLVYVVYNSITCLLTQEEQVACFRNAARHLEPGGRFVIEVSYPNCSACRRVRPRGPFTSATST